MPSPSEKAICLCDVRVASRPGNAGTPARQSVVKALSSIQRVLILLFEQRRHRVDSRLGWEWRDFTESEDRIAAVVDVWIAQLLNQVRDVGRRLFRPGVFRLANNRGAEEQPRKHELYRLSRFL